MLRRLTNDRGHTIHEKRTKTNSWLEVCILHKLNLSSSRRKQLRSSRRSLPDDDLAFNTRNCGLGHRGLLFVFIFCCPAIIVPLRRRFAILLSFCSLLSSHHPDSVGSSERNTEFNLGDVMSYPMSSPVAVCSWIPLYLFVLLPAASGI
jgi:hypothetical protein